MTFLIADTFSDSLGRLTGDEQKAVKTTAFDLQMNPASPGLQFHRLDKARDKNFWSVRVSADVRLIVHRSDQSLLLCYVDHHDKAYDWAERRRLETHPRTGAAQFVEIRETVKEVVVPVFVQQPEAPPQPTPRPAAAPAVPFAHVPDDDLLAFGVPSEWLRDVRDATELSLLELIDHLPGEAAEALLELATGGSPRREPALAVHERTETWPEAPAAPAPAPPPPAAFEHPDAQRRFRVVSNVEELQRALEFPWDKWTVYLHPEQRQLVERQFSGPAKVAGSAGTGKTIVALHRAVHLARANPDARVLLTTFSDPLATALRGRLARLAGNEPRLAERIDVEALPAVGRRLHAARVGPVTLATDAIVRDLMAESAAATAPRFPLSFLLSEWTHVVDAWQVADWPAYRDLVRLGRKVRLPEAQRAALWAVFDRVRDGLRSRGVTTEAGMFTALAQAVERDGPLPYTYAIVDEAQDLSVPQLRFLAALGRARPDALFFAGDTGQRIFQQPFSWKGLGIDIRGRSKSLRVNYRTSQQIRTQADRLLEPESRDADGEVERRDAVSVFSGPPPEVWVKPDPDTEVAAVGGWLKDRLDAGVAPHECAVFVRSEAQLPRAQAAIAAAGASVRVLDGKVDVRSGAVQVCTMHLAKGLEFRAVVVMACDDEVLPLQERIEAVGDDGDLEETYNSERQLLYVACTRARDFLLVSGSEPASEFLDDLRRSGG
jgi:hypothetical protein